MGKLALTTSAGGIIPFWQCVKCVYRVNVGIAGGRRQRAVDVDQLDSRKRPCALTTCCWNLLFQYERTSVGAVFQSTVPRRCFHEVLVRFDAAAFHLWTNEILYVKKLIVGIQIKKDGKDSTNMLISGSWLMRQATVKEMGFTLWYPTLKHEDWIRRRYFTLLWS